VTGPNSALQGAQYADMVMVAAAGLIRLGGMAGPAGFDALNFIIERESALIPPIRMGLQLLASSVLAWSDRAAVFHAVDRRASRIGPYLLGGVAAQVQVYGTKFSR